MDNAILIARMRPPEFSPFAKHVMTTVKQYVDSKNQGIWPYGTDEDRDLKLLMMHHIDLENCSLIQKLLLEFM